MKPPKGIEQRPAAQWVPKIGERVRFVRQPVGVTHAVQVGDVGRVVARSRLMRDDVVVDCERDDDDDTWICSPADIEPAPPAPRPCWVQQTKPSVPWELRTPLQQRGWAP